MKPYLSGVDIEYIQVDQELHYMSSIVQLATYLIDSSDICFTIGSKFSLRIN